MMHKQLTAIDKNGTKYYHCTNTCTKCNGTGIIACYVPINGGICFDCDGSGIVEWDEKEYTPEHRAKLDAAAKKRAEKKLATEKAKAPETNAKFFEKNGFNSEGKTYFVLGKTYEIKEELKAQGAKWDGITHHWHLPHDIEGRHTVEITADEMCPKDYAGCYYWAGDNLEYREKVEAAENSLKAEADKSSEYVGTIGDKAELILTYVHTSSWDTNYGGYWQERTTNLHTFKDDKGNVFIWKTGLYIEADYGEKLLVRGTIKDHNEYKGLKQTVLTRCKISEAKD